MKRFRPFLLALTIAVTLAACAPALQRSGSDPTSTTARRAPSRSLTATPTTPPASPSSPSGSVPAPAAAGKTWTQTFGEEFNGTDYDHSKLSPCFDWNYGACTGSFNKGREWYSASRISVNDGTAKLSATPGTSPNADNTACLDNRCTYVSGLLSTSRPNAGNGSDYDYKFTYGYVEARMKLPATQGFFTAFWMLPANPSYNYRSEIDIAEVLGYDPKTIYMNYHYNNRSQDYTPNKGTGNNGACATDDKTGKFVRFGLDWEPNSIAWYIDGVKCGQFNGPTENGPMQIIMNLMVDHQWERDFGHPLLDPTLTRQLEIDYLRVYQQR